MYSTTKSLTVAGVTDYSTHTCAFNSLPKFKEIQWGHCLQDLKLLAQQLKQESAI